MFTIELRPTSGLSIPLRVAGPTGPTGPSWSIWTGGAERTCSVSVWSGGTELPVRSEVQA